MKKLWMTALAVMALMMTGCSDDETNPAGGDGTGGGQGDLKEILFGDGTQIGNGDNEFEIKGKYTLPEGTYTLVGWVYICDGAELTIEPGTVIKGDKATTAARVAERAGQNDRMQENGRLGHLRLLELLVRAGEHDIRDRKPQDFVGPIEQLLGQRNVVVKVLAHSDELGALTREYECVHSFLQFGLRVQR